MRAVLVLTALGLTVALGLYVLWGYQEDRVLRAAMGQIKAFRDSGVQATVPEQRGQNYDLALRHLGQYLSFRPNDPEALEIQAQLLTVTASQLDDFLHVASVYEHLLRVEPEGQRAQDARRRAAALYIQYSEGFKESRGARLFPEETVKNLRYRVAELRVDQLLDPKARPRVDDAEAHRLRAMALEGQITKDKTLRIIPRREGDLVVDLLQGAIDEYEATLKRDPGDLLAAARLARLYQESKHNMASARRVLDGLLKARPDSVDVRLLRYDFENRYGDNVAATGELEAAATLAPEDLRVILQGAIDALQGERRDVGRARDWIAKVPGRFRDDPRVLTMEGFIDYVAQNPTAAINTWNKGLERTNGLDKNLIWWLAYASLEIGREDKAREYMKQYRPLVADKDPQLQFLEALQNEREGQYTQAIERLESARDQLDASRQDLQEQIRLVLGRCQEKLGDRDEAEKTFRAALQVAQKSLALRLSLTQLLLKTGRNEEAIKLLEQGLQSTPNQPNLLIVLADAKLRLQKERPQARRNWADFDATFKQAAAVAPQHPALALIQADRMQAEGGLDRAIQVLKENAGKAPNSAEIAVALAEGLIQQGRTDQALQVLEQASRAVDRGLLRVARARVLAALGRGREARTLLLQNLNRLSPGDRSEVWKTFVLLCRAQADSKTTRAAFEEWARQLPNDSRPKLGLLDLAIEEGDEEQVGATLTKLRPPDDEDQDDPTWLLAEARVKLWRRSRLGTNPEGRNTPKDSATSKRRATLLEDADVRVERVLRETKVDPQALLLKGLIYEETGELERAADAYSRSWSHGNANALSPLVEILARLGRKDELARLRQSDRMNQLDRIEAMAFLRHGDKTQAVQVVEQSLRDQPGNPSWQVGMLNVLDEGKKAESALRAMAEQQPGRLEPWLSLLQFQASHGQGAQAVEATIAEIKRQVKTDRPELLEARCRWAAGDRPRADQAYDEALKRFPDDREVLMAAAMHFEVIGRPDRAEACLRHVLERDPNQRPAARQLALILATRPDSWAQALTVLGPEDPSRDTPEERLARAAVLAQGPGATDRQRARELLEALVADLPAGAPAAVSARDVLVRLLLAVGQAKRASEVAAISATSGSNPAAIALYAEALLQSGQFDAVEVQLNRLALLNNGRGFEANLRARVIQARAQKEKTQPGTAAAKLEQTYLARENTPGAEVFGREAFSMLLKMGPDALDVADRLGRRLAGHKPALSWMPALILARRGRRDEALALCRTAVQDGKSRADLLEACQITLQVAVTARTEAAALKQADEILNTALKHASASDELQVMKAMLSHLQGRFDEEVRLYRAVLVHQPRNPVVLNNIAWALSEGLNQPSEALERIDDLLKLAGRNAECLDTRGMILLRLGRLDEAVKDLEEAAQVDPKGLRHYHLAQAYKKMGRDADFRRALAEARRAGLTAASIDPTERAEFEALINL